MAGHDINYLGLTGALDAIGTMKRPIPPLNLVADYGGGTMFAIAGILAAIIERHSTDRGQVVDVAMVDGAGSLFGPIRALADSGVWREGRQSNLLDGGAPFYRTYRTADDRFMAVGALEPGFYSAFVSGLGLDETELPDRFDPGNWDELADRFALVFATRTRDGWQDVFDDTDGCVTPVLAMSEVMDHTHNAERGAVVTSGGGQRPAPAPRFGSWSSSPSGDTTGRGALQAATILMERGFSRDDVDRLMEAGIIADA
jgi:alpha-methylacyl-CoA racemase